MKRETVIANMLGAGLDGNTAEKAHNSGLTLTTLRSSSKQALSKIFDKTEVEQIQHLIQRQPIAEDVVNELLTKCDWACCLCWNVDVRPAIIIHHILEHSKTADDSYTNLVVLCLNHHGMAHSSWDISRHPCPPAYIRARKAEFEIAIAEFKAGTRPAPGREGNRDDPRTQSDIQALSAIARFLDRPAMHRPFHIEGNMGHFLTEMSNLIRAFNTGHYQTREGLEVDRGKPIREFSNPQWRERLTMVRDQLDITRARVEAAIRDGELSVDPGGGFYCFYNRDLPSQIDAMRKTAVSMLNPVLEQANIPMVHGWRDFPESQGVTAF